MKHLLPLLLLLTACKHQTPIKPPDTRSPLYQFTCDRSKHYGIPCSVSLALIKQESQFDHKAERFERSEYYRLSHAEPFKHLPPATLIDLSTSYGYGQVMGYHNPSNPRGLLDPYLNIETALSILSKNKERCTTLAGALTAYNTGKCSSPDSMYASVILKG